NLHLRLTIAKMRNLIPGFLPKNPGEDHCGDFRHGFRYVLTREEPFKSFKGIAVNKSESWPRLACRVRWDLI
ncbi:MAG: hypothetical protein J7J76_05935, partial [Candidatus Latescibacteria bacterium]|nr:hypothetical protein [Candidatus Latescibacterota bacterium]